MRAPLSDVAVMVTLPALESMAKRPPGSSFRFFSVRYSASVGREKISVRTATPANSRPCLRLMFNLRNFRLFGYYDQGRVRVPACACRSIRRQPVRRVSMALLSRTAEALLAAPCREMHPRLALFFGYF